MTKRWHKTCAHIAASSRHFPAASPKEAMQLPPRRRTPRKCYLKASSIAITSALWLVALLKMTSRSLWFIAPSKSTAHGLSQRRWLKQPFHLKICLRTYDLIRANHHLSACHPGRIRVSVFVCHKFQKVHSNSKPPNIRSNRDANRSRQVSPRMGNV